MESSQSFRNAIESIYEEVCFTFRRLVPGREGRGFRCDVVSIRAGEVDAEREKDEGRAMSKLDEEAGRATSEPEEEAGREVTGAEEDVEHVALPSLDDGAERSYGSYHKRVVTVLGENGTDYHPDVPARRTGETQRFERYYPWRR